MPRLGKHLLGRHVGQISTPDLAFHNLVLESRIPDIRQRVKVVDDLTALTDVHALEHFGFGVQTLVLRLLFAPVEDKVLQTLAFGRDDLLQPSFTSVSVHIHHLR